MSATFSWPDYVCFPVVAKSWRRRQLSFVATWTGSRFWWRGRPMTSMLSARRPPYALRIVLGIVIAAGAAAAAYRLHAGFDPHALALWIDAQRALAADRLAATALLYFGL